MLALKQKNRYKDMKYLSTYVPIINGRILENIQKNFYTYYCIFALCGASLKQSFFGKDVRESTIRRIIA